MIIATDGFRLLGRARCSYKQLLPASLLLLQTEASQHLACASLAAHCSRQCLLLETVSERLRLMLTATAAHHAWAGLLDPG